MRNRICVIRVDGGICSQLAFVAYGMKIGQSGENVKYDLRFYEDCGMDDLGEQVRNWDVPKLLPGLKIDVATDEEVSLAKAGRKGFRYIDGYPNRTPALVEYADSFRAMMNPALDSSSQALFDQIQDVPSCAIHVRRGDLAKGHVGYGKPTPIEYFKNAILFERARTSGKANFFVFSDDTEWTEANIMPLLGGGGIVHERF